MIQEQKKRVAFVPAGNANQDEEETVDLAGQIPDVEDILARLDSSIVRARMIHEQEWGQNLCRC